MSSRTFLEKLGVLFPYNTFSRLSNEQEMTSACGGVAALVAICAIIAILAMKLVEVFQMTTVISSSASTMTLLPPMTTVSTYQDGLLAEPYMLALGYYKDMFYNSTAAAAAYYVEVQGPYSDPNRTIKYTPISLEPCTAQHFSAIPNIVADQTTWGIANWVCLPLNQTWQVGGDYELSTNYKRIQVNISCTFSENHVDCGYYKLYTLNTFINPSDALQPSTYYISQDTFLVKGQSYYEYSSRLDLNTLDTDGTVLPGSKLASTTSLEANPIVLQTVMNLAPIYQTVLKVEKSGKVTSHKRAFLKLLDALAYVGGIFNSLLAIFFFMAMFMRFFFEMKFADYYFKCEEAKEVGFFSFGKQMVYGMLSATPFKPNWELNEKRISLRETVNKVLDLFYLHKRIAFLEKAITLLLDEHHIKGLHLANSLTREEADKKYKQFRLRDRIVVFLHKYRHTSHLFGKLGDSSVESAVGFKKDGGEAYDGRGGLSKRKIGVQHEAEVGDGAGEEELR
jgi:hypothetical protein